jgi:hypothetical protein
MEESCELLSNCGYFDKYKDSKTTLCQGWIRQFCQGPKMNECKRKMYRHTHGTPPPVDMMPSGHMMPESLRKQNVA